MSPREGKHVMQINYVIVNSMKGPLKNLTRKMFLPVLSLKIQLWVKYWNSIYIASFSLVHLRRSTIILCRVFATHWECLRVFVHQYFTNEILWDYVRFREIWIKLHIIRYTKGPKCMILCYYTVFGVCNLLEILRVF